MFLKKVRKACYSGPAAVTITIKECRAPVPVCAYFPGSVVVKVDSSAGQLRLLAELGGSASGGQWATSGSGTFGAADSVRTDYRPSVSDYANGQVTLTFLTGRP